MIKLPRVLNTQTKYQKAGKLVLGSLALARRERVTELVNSSNCFIILLLGVRTVFKLAKVNLYIYIVNVSCKRILVIRFIVKWFLNNQNWDRSRWLRSHRKFKIIFSFVIYGNVKFLDFFIQLSNKYIICDTRKVSLSLPQTPPRPLIFLPSFQNRNN